MFKMHHIIKKISIFVKSWGLSAPFLVTWSWVIWPIVVFQTDYDNIKLRNSVMASFQRRHRYYAIEKLHQTSVPFSIFGLYQSKFLAAQVAWPDCWVSATPWRPTKQHGPPLRGLVDFITNWLVNKY